jgi:hypothetical protein
MKRLLSRMVLLLLTLLPVRQAEADYAPLLTTEMIGLADLIVLGTIQRVDVDVFVLRVERQLYGPKAEPGPLVVRRFRNWTCASRWAPYEVGQRLILFLGSGSGTDQRWRILGAGDEGEMLVEGDSVYYQLWPDRRQRRHTHSVRGGQFYGVVALSAMSCLV